MHVFLVIAVIVAAYLAWLWVKPWWTCRSCGGAEVRPGAGRSHGRCRTCKGNGRYPRIGVRILMPGTARKMREGKKGIFY